MYVPTHKTPQSDQRVHLQSDRDQSVGWMTELQHSDFTGLPNHTNGVSLSYITIQHATQFPQQHSQSAMCVNVSANQTHTITCKLFLQHHHTCMYVYVCTYTCTFARTMSSDLSDVYLSRT